MGMVFDVRETLEMLSKNLEHEKRLHQLAVERFRAGEEYMRVKSDPESSTVAIVGRLNELNDAITAYEAAVNKTGETI